MTPKSKKTVCRFVGFAAIPLSVYIVAKPIFFNALSGNSRATIGWIAVLVVIVLVGCAALIYVKYDDHANTSDEALLNAAAELMKEEAARPDEATRYYAARPNQSAVNPRVAVFFIAASGSGKTTLTHRFVQELKATYLSNDDARAMVGSDKPDEEIRAIVTGAWDLLRRDSQNGLVVFDSNMSRTYMRPDSYSRLAEAYGYQSFVIDVDIPLDVLRERIASRGRFDTDEVLRLLPDQLAYNANARRELTANIVVRPETDISEVVAALATFVKEAQAAPATSIAIS